MAAAVKAAENGHKLVTLGELVALPLPFEDVSLPNGSTIRLFAIRGSERIELAKKASQVGDDAEANMRFMHEVIAVCLPDATPEEVGRLPSNLIDVMTPAAMRMAGISTTLIEQAVAALKASPSGDSGSA